MIPHSRNRSISNTPFYKFTVIKRIISHDTPLILCSLWWSFELTSSKGNNTTIIIQKNLYEAPPKEGKSGGNCFFFTFIELSRPTIGSRCSVNFLQEVFVSVSFPIVEIQHCPLFVQISENSSVDMLIKTLS